KKFAGAGMLGEQNVSQKSYTVIDTQRWILVPSGRGGYVWKRLSVIAERGSIWEHKAIREPEAIIFPGIPVTTELPMAETGQLTSSDTTPLAGDPNALFRRPAKWLGASDKAASWIGLGGLNLEIPGLIILAGL